MKPGLIFARQIEIPPSFEAWRDRARELLHDAVRPEEISIVDEQSAASPLLFTSAEEAAPSAANIPVAVPHKFVERAKIVACHRSPDRWNLLYRLLWRLQENRQLLKIEIDEDVVEFGRLERQVRRDLHKMHAFARFRKVREEDGDHYIAWYEPDHFILDLAVPFFVERFAVMRWSIFTPASSVTWDPNAHQATRGPGVRRERAPESDDLEELWRTYYRSIFNPARTNTTAMRSEMPARYWKNLPEIETLPDLLSQADRRVHAMIGKQANLTPASFVPVERSLPIMEQAIKTCQGCDLFRCATQAVFGRGPGSADMMFVGEQPGDEEDRRGEPFVGPAGRLLNEVMNEVGIGRETVYVTNAVKHFKFTERGKRRIHESPRLHEIFACRPWLLAEIDAVRPKLVVCLGASSAKSLLGASFALMRERGKVIASQYGQRVIATIHPSAILRATDPERSSTLRAMLAADLQLAQSVAADAVSGSNDR